MEFFGNLGRETGLKSAKRPKFPKSMQGVPKDEFQCNFSVILA